MSLQSIVDAALEALGDRTAFLKGVLSGAVNFATDLVSATGQYVTLNGTRFRAVVDGGGVEGALNVDGLLSANGLTLSGPLTSSGAATFTSFVRSAKRVAQGPTATSINIISASVYEHLYCEVPVASGCIWKMDNTGVNPGETMRLSLTDPTHPVQVQDQTGTVIVNLSFVSGFYYAVTVCYLGGAWVVIDRSYHS
jgi:hypothetical protein